MHPFHILPVWAINLRVGEWPAGVRGRRSQEVLESSTPSVVFPSQPTEGVRSRCSPSDYRRPLRRRETLCRRMPSEPRERAVGAGESALRGQSSPTRSNKPLVSAGGHECPGIRQRPSLPTRLKRDQDGI